MGGFNLLDLSSHRTKPDKQTFSERQRQRRAQELSTSADGRTSSEGAIPFFRHRTKDTLTFSERQRQRKGQGDGRRNVLEEEALQGIGGLYTDTYIFPSPSGSPIGSPDDSPGRVRFKSGSDREYPSLTLSADLRSEEEKDEENSSPGALVVSQVAGLRRRPFWHLRLGKTAKKLLSGAVAGGISRTAVAPLETIRTHLMVGSNTGQSNVISCFGDIVRDEGWQGLFRGNGLNVIRVAPSKAIELFTFEAVKNALTPKDGSRPRFPISPIAGSTAGIVSCLITYPLELVKTRLTVQHKAYRGVFDAFYKIATTEGFSELYRGLLPSVIGVIPYAGFNYFAYDALRSNFKRVMDTDRIGNIETMAIGSLAGAIASTATFPLEVARKQMQVGALHGRVVYKGTIHCLQSILAEQGWAGLYKGLGPSCLKLMPAAGISFMCYEALKRVLEEEEQAGS